MDALEVTDHRDLESTEPLVSRHWIGLRGRLTQPFWGWLGGWGAVCGALASNQLRWDETLLNLALALLMVELGWGSLWDVAVGSDWPKVLSRRWPPGRPARVLVLPYTRPHSPAGRLTHALSLVTGWWRETLWPTAGPALLGLFASIILTAVLALYLPERLHPLHLILAALGGLALLQRRRGKEPLATHALSRVCLAWLAGHGSISDLDTTSAIVAAAFALSAWGNLRVGAAQRRGIGLLIAGQVAAIAVLLSDRQPLAAGLVILLLLAQVALLPSLHYGGPAAHITVSRRTWPWLMLVMLGVAWALP